MAGIAVHSCAELPFSLPVQSLPGTANTGTHRRCHH
jgi:hypothetical protein